MKITKKIASLILAGFLICGTNFDVFATEEEPTRTADEYYQTCYEEDIEMQVKEADQYFEVSSYDGTIRWEAQKVDDAVYAACDCFARKSSPNINSKDEATLTIGQEVHRVGLSPNGWDLIEINREYYFVWYSCLTDEKPATLEAAYTASDFQWLGVITWGGSKWTYYSQRVLPGTGLNIPGRHVDESGFVCDENDYIVLAADLSYISRGTVIETPFGKYGKIYDTGCAYGVVDCYCDW